MAGENAVDTGVDADEMVAVEGERRAGGHDGAGAAQRDVELLLPAVGLVVRLGGVPRREVHDLDAEGGDAEAVADELREAVPELGQLVDRLAGDGGPAGGVSRGWGHLRTSSDG